jgi:YVTN family beta-propeller protein
MAVVGVTLSRRMTDLPSGAITFLFTDIEGSTRLLKQLRERYAEVLAEHQRLLRGAFAAYGGYEVDTQGDAFFVAFTSARAALLAAVDGQLALRSHAWPEGVEVKVRMGIHTGQAIAADGRYTGLAVHRAARIGAAGHGGQVLVSQATQTLLEDDEEDLHVSLQDLGEQQLKDLDRPVRLYQAAANGLPESFPPVRGGAELPAMAEAALPAPAWRRPSILVAIALGTAVLVALAAFLAGRDSPSGLSGVRPNHLGVIDPATNDIVGEVAVGIRPGPVTADAGSVWVGNVEDRTLTRVDASTRASAATVSLDGRTPTGVALGSGSLWVAHGRRGELSQVDTQFNRLATTVEVTPVGADRGAVAHGEGAVWAAYGDATLARVDPATVRVEASGLAGGEPAALVVARGSVWVASASDANVSRFDPSTIEDGPLRIISVGQRPAGIAYGADAIWVANSGDGTVTRIDPSTYATSTIAVGAEPVAVAYGENAVWVANRGDWTLSRIDPATNDVVDTIEVGNVPAGVTVAGGLVWVTVEAP